MNALSGRLQDEPLPLLLHRLQQGRATGVLRIETRIGRHEVFVRDGFPVAVHLPGSAELIGQVLLEMRLIDDATHKRSLSQPPPAGRRYGDWLVEQKLVAPDQLRLALKAQVRRKLHRLFFVGEGDFKFEELAHDEGRQGNESLQVQPARAIYHGVRSAWSAERLQSALFLLDGRALKCTLDADNAARYGLGADDGRVAELLRRGYWTLADLIEASGLPAQPVHALVYSLYVTEALDVRGADEVPRLKKRAGDGPRTGSFAAAESPTTQKTTLRTTGSFTAPAIPGPAPDSFDQHQAPTPEPRSKDSFAAQQPTTPKPRSTDSFAAQQPTTPQPRAADSFAAQQPQTPKPRSTDSFAAPQPTTPQPRAADSFATQQPTTPRPRSGDSFTAPQPTTPGRITAPTPSNLPAVNPETIRNQITLKAKVVEDENLFTVLGIREDATAEQVKAAYFESAKRYHPDRLTALGLEALRPEVEKIFRRVGEAYSTLYDDHRRAEYRAKMSQPGGSDPSAHAKALTMIEAEMAMRRGEVLLKKSDFAGAIRELERAVAGNPQEGEHLAYLTWARVCARQMTFADAKPRFVEATRLSPGCARAFYFLGLALKEEKDTDRAYNMFRKAVDLDARLLDAEREMRLINMRRGKEEKRGLFDRFRKPAK